MESILAALATIAVGAFAFWGALWKAKANRRQAELDAIHRESDAHAKKIARNLEEARRQAAGMVPIDQKKRTDFEQ